MLVLTRLKGQSIFISPSNDIPPDMTAEELFASGPLEIIVTNAIGQVKIGIQAPKELAVLREELVV